MSILKAPPGSLTIICGSMFSGKTEELIRLVRRAMHARKRVQVFKSALDTRCDTTVIRTHDGMTFTALAVPDSRAMESLLEPNVQIVGIEEVQFFDEGVIGLCQRLADRGVEVIAAGLDQDFRGMPFSFMPQLMALADNVMKLHAICKVCGQEASRTQRLVNGRPAGWDEPTILVGADESYEARCRRCHQVRNVPPAFRTFPKRGGNGKAATPEAGTSRKPRATANTPEKHAANGKNNKNGKHSAGEQNALPHDETQLEMFPELPV